MNAKEMFEKLGFKYNKNCYEYPLKYDKKRKVESILEVDEDSFSFYQVDKVITIWKDGRGITLDFKELQAINKQIEELGWNNE